MTRMKRINRLSSERASLYRMALNGHSGDPDVRRRIDDVTRELDALWDERRRERAGRVEGIDLLVERSYAQLYGSNYADAVAPIPVAATEDEAATIAA